MTGASVSHKAQYNTQRLFTLLTLLMVPIHATKSRERALYSKQASWQAFDLSALTPHNLAAKISMPTSWALLSSIITWHNTKALTVYWPYEGLSNTLSFHDHAFVSKKIAMKLTSMATQAHISRFVHIRIPPSPPPFFALVSAFRDYHYICFHSQ